MKRHFPAQFFVCVLIILSISCLIAQAPEIIWEHSYGGSEWDYAGAIHQTLDYGYIIGGYTGSSDGDILENLGLYDYWILKLDSNGIIEWQKSYGGANYDFCYDIACTTDSGYILVGGSYSSDGDVTGAHGNLDYWVVKIDAVGNIEWQKALGGTSADIAHSVIQTFDGGYFVVGGSNSNDGNVTGHHGDISDSDIWVVKLDAFGELVWERSFGSFEDDGANDVIQAIDGSYVVVGYVSSINGDVDDFHGGASDWWVIKISTIGDLLWEDTFGGSEGESAFSIIESAGFDYYIGGYTLSTDGDILGFMGGPSDVWLIKLDSLGNCYWKKCYGGSNSDNGKSIFLTGENKITVAGYSASSDGDATETRGGGDFWLFEIDTLGSIIWQKTIGGSDGDVPFSIINSLDQNYIVAGYSRSSDYDLSLNHGDFDYWIVKLGVCDNVYYADMDGDGFGDLFLDSVACEIPIGFVAISTDCNDSNNLIYPGAEEICDYFDNDCNGIIDDNLTYIHSFEDADSDNYGNIDVDSLSCEIPDGFVEDDSDCDDTNPFIYPGAEEILNGIDDDCNELIDEGLEIVQNVFNPIEIYPNPTNGILHIEYHDCIPIALEIINLDGQIVYSYQNKQQIDEIDLKNLAPGVYFLKIITATEKQILNFVRY